MKYFLKPGTSVWEGGELDGKYLQIFYRKLCFQEVNDEEHDVKLLMLIPPLLKLIYYDHNSHLLKPLTISN